MSEILRHWVILLALTVVAGAFSEAKWRLLRATPDPNEVTVDQVEERWNNEVVWIDARTPSEYEAGHVFGAVNLSQSAWNDQLFVHYDNLASARKPILIYCDAAACQLSKKVAEDLRGIGISEVYHLKGGWPALRKSSLKRE